MYIFAEIVWQPYTGSFEHRSTQQINFHLEHDVLQYETPGPPTVIIIGMLMACDR